MRKPFVEDMRAVDHLGMPRFARVFQKKTDRSETVRIFHTSPDEGSDCLCSWCGKSIPEPVYSGQSQQNPREAPAVRLYADDDACAEARFHPRCFDQAVEALQVMPAESDQPD